MITRYQSATQRHKNVDCISCLCLLTQKNKSVGSFIFSFTDMNDIIITIAAVM